MIAHRVHSYPAVDVLTVFDNSCGLNDLDFRNVNSEAAALYTSSSKYSIVAKLHSVVPISYKINNGTNMRVKRTQKSTNKGRHRQYIENNTRMERHDSHSHLWFEVIMALAKFLPNTMKKYIHRFTMVPQSTYPPRQVIQFLRSKPRKTFHCTFCHNLKSMCYQLSVFVQSIRLEADVVVICIHLDGIGCSSKAHSCKCPNRI
jgi:hypothetical protein